MSSIVNKGGRPRGRRKTSKVEILLEPEVKKEFMECLKSEGKCASIEVGNWIKEYIQNYSVTKK